MLSSLLLACCLVYLVEGGQPTRITAYPPGTQLTGAIAPDAFIVFLGWSLVLNEPQSVWTQWCASRIIGDPGTNLGSIRTNRCLHPEIQPLNVFIVQTCDIPNFTLFVSNGTIIESWCCPTAQCNVACRRLGNEIVGGCAPQPLSVFGFSVSLVVRSRLEPEPPAFPSPLYCHRVHALADCSGEIIATGCLSNCQGFLSPAPSILQLECPRDGVLTSSSCPISGSNFITPVLQCSAGGCTIPLASSVRLGCQTLPNSLYGFEGFGCTVTSQAGLHPHGCSGMIDSAAVTCPNRNRTEINGQASLTVAGNWATSDEFVIRNPKQSGPLVQMRGAFSPSKQLEIRFPTQAEAVVGRSFPLFEHANGVTANARGTSTFETVTAVVESTQTPVCVQVTHQSTLTSATIASVGSSCNSGLSPGAIAGIAVGCALVGVALIVVLVALMFKRRATLTHEMQQTLREKEMGELQTQYKPM